DELVPAYAHSGFVREREGTRTLNAVPHGHYQTRDGKWIAIACTNDRMFERFCDMMGRPGLAAAETYGPIARRLAAYADVDRLVTDFVIGLDRDELMQKCIAFEVPASPVNTIADIFADPHVKARGTLVEVADWRGKPVTLPNVVPRLSETPGEVTAPGPLLGDATRQVLQDLAGLDTGEIDRLAAKGVI
ncbi:MAG: CoA transferase, partial [Pseudomonadota bacterium]|nr:CoA transferase [Pseudomonadota bacterium]